MDGCARDFARDYQLNRLPELRALERKVLGCDYGGTSWTTRDEAELIAGRLGLRPGVRLLDLGAGSGWPALFLSQLTGCETVLSDLPLQGLRIAAERAAVDGVHTRCSAVAADGAALPFERASFDRLSHSDVLCCMPQKRALLIECRRVARPAAKMAFSAILPAPGLNEAEHRQALSCGPPFVDVPAPYAALLREAGWRVLEHLDVSTEYLQSLRLSREEMQAREARLNAELGPEQFSARLTRRGNAIAGVEKGLLKREIFVALAEA